MHIMLKESILNVPYYSKTFRKLQNTIQEKQPRKKGKQFFFLQKIAPKQNSKVVTSKIVKLCSELVPNLLFSEDMTFFDFFMCLNLKEFCSGHKLGSNEEVISSNGGLFGGP
jgi:hypothetical protein